MPTAEETWEQNSERGDKGCGKKRGNREGSLFDSEEPGVFRLPLLVLSSSEGLFKLFRLCRAALMCELCRGGIQRSSGLSCLFLKCPYPLRQIVNVDVATLWGEVVEGRIQVEQVVRVQPARPLAAKDVLCQLLRVLRANKLFIIWSSNVD